ncbi:MAG: chromate transporter [Acholeplasmataceae bacterium]|nr:chromate transporter [Acholeplasmataceae bacterium]
MQDQKPISWMSFLGDVLKCSLSAFGGPEAHYGVFSSVLVDQRKYLSEPELTEMIGVYALVPGPSSTQTITAIGYHVGGPFLAFLTFLVWAFPAILLMGLLDVFFERVISNASWMPLIRFLPAVAIGFIFYAAIRLTHKVVKVRKDVLLYIVMLILALLLVGLSMWVVPILLLSGGLLVLYPHLKGRQRTEVKIRPKWSILVVIVGLALLNEGLRT